MKKLLLLPCVIFLVCALHAQSVSLVPYTQKQSFGFKSKVTPHLLLQGTQNVGYQHAAQPTNTTVDNMPVAGVGDVKFLYKGNNGNGFSVYNATPDYMPVLRPDSTFYSAMPVKPTEKEIITPRR